MTALGGATARDEAAIAAYPPLLSHVLSGKEFGPFLRSPDRPKHQAEWRDLIRDLARLPPSSKQLAEDFHTQWHVCHHYLRELVDADDLLIDMLWVWLPRYQGSDMVLYRGENIDRFEAGRIGTAWTDKQETAEMFASGLNAVSKGGVVLRANVPASTIIAGPSKHSLYLGESEFTIDIRKTRFEAAIRFPPSQC
jgi:hypothetical protein